MDFNILLKKFLVWRIKYLSNKEFIVILSIIIGLSSGLAAVILKSIVHFIHFFLTEGFKTEYNTYLYIGYPLFGIVLTIIFIRLVLCDKFERGVAGILNEIAKKSSIVKKNKMYSHLITSSITVGFGGSVGLEAPIVVTGSAIGSNLGNLMHLDAKKRALLIGCGAAGGISAIFNSPVAGVLFALEILLIDFAVPSFIPLLIASVCGTLMSKMFLGEEILFNFNIKDTFSFFDLPFFILLGILCGFISLYFVRIMSFMEKIFKRIQNEFKKAIIAGIFLGIFILLFPPLYGEGYYAIKALLTGNSSDIINNTLMDGAGTSQFVVLIFIGCMILIKVFATALTINGGGNGGIFAPSMFLGAMTGFFFTRIINLTGLDANLSESNFTLVAMAGIVSAVLHAPLTAIFLIAEITNGYLLFIPLMIVSALSYTTIIYFEPHSLYTKKLGEQGELLRGNKDRQVLNILNLEKIIEQDLLKVPIESNLGDLVKIIASSRRNIFPVINNNDELMGIILLDDIREIMFDSSMYDKIKISNILHAPPDIVQYTDSMDEVMKKFESTEAWNLPVLKDGKYFGFVSKSNIFSRYRRLLIRESKTE